MRYHLLWPALIGASLATPMSHARRSCGKPASNSTVTTGSTVTTSSTVATSTAPAKSSAAATSSTGATNSTGSGAGSWKWMGVDESGAEFGETNIPGTYNKDYIFPDTDTIKTLMGDGFNIFRLPFLMERMAQGTMTAALDAAYLANYTAVVTAITSAGGWAVLDPHNYGRYGGSIISSADDFQTFWTNLAAKFADNANVIFDTNNEYHDMDEALVVSLNQAAIDGIRAAGAASQYIFAEGNSYTGAWKWNATNDAMAALADPAGRLVFEMHQYLDADGSGTSADCVSGTVGVERVSGATAWLRKNGKVGVLGEFAGGANAVCKEAITGMLDHLRDNSDVWMGALWWGGGPWWGDYIYSFEPPSGTAYTYYESTLAGYVP